jgi:hypothetical protein
MQLHEEEKSFVDEGGHVMLQHDCGKSSQRGLDGTHNSPAIKPIQTKLDTLG